MSVKISARQMLTPAGWRRNARVTIDDSGTISEISDDETGCDHRVGVLLPAMSNVHSHSFQRAMAGLAERRGPDPVDDFWTWRQVMYRFLDVLSPDDIEVIAAQVQMEMLEAGYAAQAEFHYLHHGPGGRVYDQIIEAANRLNADAIVMGSHAPELSDYLLGPNAARVVRHARQSVFVVRGD